MSDCRFGVSPVNYPDPDPENGTAGANLFRFEHPKMLKNRFCSLYLLLTFNAACEYP